ncbi:MAG: aminotransferase class I/II-fold pyridoxal phosphate-dependent enzyme [Alphaproteobacteria bacterium]|nr:aminotransferase class I/II-fold pyridoxal phosphate-dependent enzyme [Alphaproteobacteria bacterium]
MVNNRIGQFHGSAFSRLADLLGPVKPPAGLAEINMGIGEPQHAQPAMVAKILAENAALWSKYPPVNATPAFRTACAGWLTRRFGLPAGMIDPERHILSIAGTKEALFMAGLVAVPETKGRKRPVVLMPDPFYQVYVGGAAFAGAEPVFLPATAETGFLPDFAKVPAEILDRTALAYLCSPANPQGAVASLDYLQSLIRLARRHDFILAFDECYTELYYTAEPSPGGLEACARMGGDMANVLTFHSLSKRSSVPGLRSGFVAGPADLIQAFLKVRTFGGVASPLPLVATATALWNDDAHVAENRALYRRKYEVAQRILGNRFGFYRPDGGFYLWLDVGDGEAAAKRLWGEAAIRVLPGGYLGIDGPDGGNPGRQYIRAALVHDVDTVSEALQRISQVL